MTDTAVNSARRLAEWESVRRDPRLAGDSLDVVDGGERIVFGVMESDGVWIRADKSDVIGNVEDVV